MQEEHKIEADTQEQIARSKPDIKAEEVDEEAEFDLEQSPKLLSICQFLSMFRNIMKIYPSNYSQERSDTLEFATDSAPYFKEGPEEENQTMRMVTPEELAHSILHP